GHRFLCPYRLFVSFSTFFFLLLLRLPPLSTLFPYTTLFRSICNRLFQIIVTVLFLTRKKPVRTYTGHPNSPELLNLSSSLSLTGHPSISSHQPYIGHYLRSENDHSSYYN